MTVAAAIEINAGGSPMPGLGKVFGAAHGAGRAGAASQSNNLPSIESGAESFRTGWQSLLASLGSSVEASSKTGTAADQVTTAARPALGSGAAPEAAPGKTSVSTSTQAALADLRLGEGAGKGTGEPGAAALSAAGARAGAMVARPSAGAVKPALTATVAKAASTKTKSEASKPATEPKTESARSLHPAHSIEVAKPEVVAAEPMPGAVPAAIASPPQAVLTPTVASPVAHSTDVEEQSAEANLPVALPTGFATASIAPHSSKPERPSGTTEPASAAATDKDETPAKQEQLPSTPSLSGATGPALSATELPNAREVAPPSVATVAEDGTPLESPVLGGDPAQTVVPVESATQTVAPSVNQNLTKQPTTDPNPVPAATPEPSATQTAAPAPNPIQTYANSQNLSQPPTPGSNPTLKVAPEQSATQTVVPEDRATQTVVPSENPTQVVVPGESATQTAAPTPELTRSYKDSPNPIQPQAPLPIHTATTSQNLIQPLEPAPNPTQAVVQGQNPTHTFASSQNELPMQPEKQGMDVAPALTGNDGLNPLLTAASAAASQSGQPSASAPIVGEPGTASGGKSATPGTVRSARGAGNFNAVQPGKALAQGQSSGPAADASAMTRELAARGAVGTAGELGVKSLPATGPDPRETFATLDTAGAPARPTWIHAGTQRAEAGFQDPALGWVGVRADTSGGGVHAELVAGSADAAQALGSHMAGLNAYLAEHHTPVETLTLTAPEGGWAGLGSDRGTGEGMQQGAGQQTGQGTDAGFQSGPSVSPTILAAAASELPVWSAGWDGSVQESRPVGGHISVMA